MLQQTAAEKSHSKLAFLDGLTAGHIDKKEREKILDYLSDDYTSFLRIAANLSSHSRWIPYPFLANRLKQIADDMRSQAEALRAKLVHLGGTVPQLSTDSREEVEFRQNVKRLVGDMEDHAARSEMIVHQKNNIRDNDVAALIEAIAANMQKQKNELLDIVMRLS